METEGLTKMGTDSQDSDELGPPATSKIDTNKSTINIPIPQTSNPNSPATTAFKLKPSSKGVENAKKRLRAFSIQKKTPITAISVNKSVAGSKTSSSGSTTVLIGKLSGVKVIPKTEDAELKKQPKPPKPGQNKKFFQDSYTDLQKRTLSEIEDMKRKMELVDLGIPLGLICPTANNEKAMPTKAMPPIKSFLDPAKLDEIISEAKKAKAQGKEFKFDYQKLLPDYDNPFQRKKEEIEAIKKQEFEREFYKKRENQRRKTDRFDRDSRRHSSHRKDERDKRKDEKDRHREKSKDKESKKEAKAESNKSVEKETDVNLSDYLVCDSWSLENEDKTNSSSPKRHETPKSEDKKAVKEISTELVEVKTLKKEKAVPLESPKTTPVRKIKRLQPVIDSFKFEIDPDEDEVLDIFDENSELEKYSKVTQKKDDNDSPFDKMFDFDQSSKDVLNDALTEDTFLESVINEIKQEEMSDDDGCQDKGLVEYDSPSRDDSPSPKDARSVTPELDDRMREVQSSRSDYSDGYRSTESGYKSTESGYKSNASYKSDSNSENYRMSMEKELVNMPKATVDSLETWSFVLKICQPLLFRHDRNKCYRETHSLPKIWYTENPKLCSCVKDRSIVYEELETCKMGLVDRVYGCDQIQESEFPKARGWYPRFAQCLIESNTLTTVAPSTEWEADDSQSEAPLVKGKTYKTNRSTTPVRNEEIYLDREYQRFMEAVWPEVAETKGATPRSTTPVKQEARKKKAEDTTQDDKKKAKKIKLSSEGWSQESDVEDDVEKAKKTNKIQKVDKVKVRKRKRSSSLSDSDNSSKKKRKASKKNKANKKTKLKLTKHRRLSKRYLKKLKDKQKKKKRLDSEDEDMDKENRKKEKKFKKKKLQKKKKTQKKKKSKISSSSSSSSTSSSSTSETSTDSESETQIKKKKKKSDVKKKKRKQSTSESTQSEDLFDVNVLNNIKTERLTDDEKKLEFSPRKQKPREIINVKELQNDFVGSVQIKKEVEAIAEIQKIQELELVTQREEKEFVPECASDSVTESNSESVSLSVANSVCPSVTESVCQSTAESVCQDVTETVCQNVKDGVCQEVRDSASQSLSESISQSVIDSDSKPLPESISKGEPEIITTVVSGTILENIPIPKDEHITQFKEPLDINRLTPSDRPEVTQPEELSQCSSQESTTSKDPYEKDDSHLRPSSQNSNYSFNDVISASQNYQKEEEDKFEQENYEEGNYEMYEQLAMAYQSDVAKQGNFQSPGEGQAQSEWWGSQRIETVVRVRPRGEIKCDWRAGCPPPAPPAPPTSGTHHLHRPSRWGLKPGEVNIVLTGGNNEVYPIHNVVEPVYQIQTLANNRSDNSSMGSYDEAYEDMYGASDRLQYGDCFATHLPEADISPPPCEPKKPLLISSSLDERIDRALRTTVLGEVAKDTEDLDAEKDGTEKGILHTKSTRGAKRVSFADGYKPGQDSDVEEPPKRKKKPRRFGCAWPCPASHPDHVPLWDALPPPPPPPGSPPPPFTQQPPNMLSQQMMMQQPPPMMQQQPPQMMQQQQSQMLQQQPPQLLQQQQPQMLQQQPPQMLQQQPPQMLQQQPPQMLQQQPSQMLPQQAPQMLQQQPPQMLQQQPPRMMQQQPPQMMQQQPSQMIQQQLMQQQQLLQQQGINPAMLQAPPFALGQKIDPSVSLPNFMPPEPPPGLISF